MTTERQGGVAEPGVLTSIWNHRLLVVLFAAIFGALAVLVTSLRPPDYVAEAGVLLEDPHPVALSDGRSNVDETRYVANQIAILTSAAVAERASALALTADPPSSITAGQIERNTSVSSSGESNYVVVGFRAGDPEKAAAGANAVVRAYREVIRGALDADAEAALKRLDAAIDEAAATLASGSAGTSASDPGAAEAQITAIVSELAQIRDGAVLPADVTARVRELEAELKAWLLVAQAEATLPAAVAAERERDDALALLSELRLRQSRLEVDSRLSGDGVALFSPAERGKPDGISRYAALAIGIALGALVGAGVAYWRDARTQAFSSRFDPQLLLDAPALAEIPDFRREGLDSRLPVLEAPGTESAEAFRFLASHIGVAHGSSSNGQSTARGEEWQRMFPELNDRELAVLSLAASGAPMSDPALTGSGLSRATVNRTIFEILDKLGEVGPGRDQRRIDGDELVLRAQQAVRNRQRATAGAAAHQSVAFVAASFHDGTTTLLANTALAAAQEGNRVLAIDGDVVRRDLSRLLLGDEEGTDDSEGATPTGLADVILHGTAAKSIRRVMETSAGGTLSLLAPGTATVDAIGVLRADQIAAALESIRDQFDRIVIDLPPIRDTGYADALLRSSEAVVLVIPHKSGASRLSQALDRLDLLGVRPVGYVYNYAPLRRRSSRKAFARMATKTNGKPGNGDA